MKRAFFSIACLLALSTPALAADGPSLDAVAGTTGAGAAIRVPVRNGTAVRVNLGTASFGRTATFENRVINADVHLALDERVMIRTSSLTVERMSKRGLGVVGGVVLNNTSIHAISVPTDSTVTINGATYSQAGAGVIFTDVHWSKLAPYLGIRIAPPSLHGAALELGGYYQGAARVDFSATGAIAANQSSFQPYYDDEARQLRTALAPVKVYPVVQLSIPLLRR